MEILIIILITTLYIPLRAQSTLVDTITNQYKCSKTSNGNLATSVVLVSGTSILQGITKNQKGILRQVDGIITEKTAFKASVNEPEIKLFNPNKSPPFPYIILVDGTINDEMVTNEIGRIVVSEYGYAWSGNYSLSREQEKQIEMFMQQIRARNSALRKSEEHNPPPPPAPKSPPKLADSLPEKPGIIAGRTRRPGDLTGPRYAENVGKRGTYTFNAKFNSDEKMISLGYRTSNNNHTQIDLSKADNNNPIFAEINSYMDQIKRYSKCCINDGKPECDLKFDQASHDKLPKIPPPTQEDLGGGIFSPFGNIGSPGKK